MYIHASRRQFLKQASIIPLAAAAGALIPVELSPRERSLVGQSTDTVSLVLDFSGPFALTMSGDDVVLFAAPAPGHLGSVKSDANAQAVDDGASYALLGPAAPSTPTQTILPPISFSVPGPYKTAQSLCKFSVAVKRPDFIRGIDITSVTLNLKTLYPKAPTGLRFIYNNVPRALKINLQKNGTDFFSPDFTYDDQTGTPEHVMELKLTPPNVLDPCHVDAKNAFKSLLGMFPTIPPTTIDYNDEPCAVTKGESRRLQPHMFRGPGSDCQSPIICPGC